MAKFKPNAPDYPGQRAVCVPQDIVRQCQTMPIVRDLHVRIIGSFPRARLQPMNEPRVISDAILIHCTAGRGWCRMAGRKWTIEEGQVLLIPSGEAHAYGADGRAPWSINWIHFGGRSVPAYFEVLGATREQPLLNLSESAALVQAFEEIYGLLQLGYTESSLLALSTELGRFLGLLKIHQRGFYHKGRQAEEKILESMAFMREHFGQNPCLEELAAQVGMSVPHYCSLFKRQTNSSPILFLIRLKMQRACELLTATEMPVAAIGREVGYGDQLYFWRIFKKTIGMAPTAYRRTVKS